MRGGEGEGGARCANAINFLLALPAFYRPSLLFAENKCLRVCWPGILQIEPRDTLRFISFPSIRNVVWVSVCFVNHAKGTGLQVTNNAAGGVDFVIYGNASDDP